MPKRGDWKGPIESGIRKHLGPEGQHWYRVQLGRRGKGNRRSRVVPTLEAAVALKREWLAGGLERANDPPAPGDETTTETVGDALRVYAVAHPHTAGMCAATASTLRRSYPELLVMPPVLVADDHLAIYRDVRERAGRKASGIATHLGNLRAAIRFVRSDFHVGKGVIPAEDITRHRVLTPLELKAALLATPEPVASMARLAVLTFMRQGEIRLLRRPQIDVRTQTITLARAKKGPRVVPLGREALAVLHEQCERHSHDVVFPRDVRRAGRSAGRPYSKQHVSDLWHRSMLRIGRPDFTFHDLRHHAAMTALANGASFPELQALGGWKSPKMVNRYATASNARLRELQDLAARPRGHAGRRGGA
jgi:integrase